MTMSHAAEEEARELTEHHLDEAIPAGILDGAREAWPRDKTYWFVGLFLGVVTAIEVSTYTHPDFVLWDNFATAALLLMMAVKFFTVTWWFMHLKNDNRILTTVFYFGLILAVIVYMITLFTFRFFGD
jgi:cytochrome c oxidase subunit 4